ncbi:unnamed protein product [Adineta ricciae]|uniref:Uncharacterized protein n=1 Tax=Adineta ricciae TaxID=249248 RepID=A0A813V4F8_ADIRI|nr:unnamed protein product [Adineta ricciae]
MYHNISASRAVAPAVQWKQHMEFSDTGIFIITLGFCRCILLVADSLDDVFMHLNSTLGIVHYHHSIEDCHQHMHHHENDPLFVVMYNPTDIETIYPLIHPRA